MQLAQFVDGLDLNSYEKEIILFLASVDNADANIIYKKTKVPKGRIYSVLNSLIDKKFVNVIPTSPKKYKIDDIKESIKNYLEEKKNDLGRKIKESDDIEVKPKLFTLEKNAPSVYTFTGREEHLNALISLRNRAKKRLIQVAPIFIGTFASNIAMYKALNQGIKVKVITKKITKENKKNIKECLKLGAEVRFLDSPDLVYFLVKDTDEFILGLEDYRNKEERLSLISRNKGLLVVLEQYFDNLWKKSRKIDVSKLK
jgi:sugar-specific transcriptional regulator TrmB